MRTSLLLLLCSATLMACFPEPPDRTGGEPPPARTFNRETFESQVLPALSAGGCLACHSAAANMGNFGLYPMPASAGERDQNFTEATGLVSASLTDASQAKTAALYVKATVSHSGSTPIADATVLENWIIVGLGGVPVGGGGPDAGPVGGGEPFDAEAFASQIQPALDGNNCIRFCHNVTSPSGDFGLTFNATAGSAEMEANRQAAIDKVDAELAPGEAAMSALYVAATDTHSGNPITDAAKLEALRSWIASGLTGP
jgi:hypothetical protein